MIGLNLGSGQRRFDTSLGWINIDCLIRPPDQVPDIVCDIQQAIPYEDNSIDYCVLHHVYEHWGLGEGDSVIRESCRVLRPGGKLLIFIPDIKALATRWLQGQLSDYLFFVNVYGAFQGVDSDRHKWCYSFQSLCDNIAANGQWACIREFDWQAISGANFANDWWILSIAATKL